MGLQRMLEKGGGYHCWCNMELIGNAVMGGSREV